jgi:hypothetical protein
MEYDPEYASLIDGLLGAMATPKSFMHGYDEMYLTCSNYDRSTKH